MKILISILLTFLSSFNNTNELKHYRIPITEIPQLQKKQNEGQNNSQYNVEIYPFVNDVNFNVIGNVSESNLILYRKEYLSLPPVLKNSISKISITSIDLNSYCGISSSYKVKGCAISISNEIYLDEIYRYGDLLHESIHTFSYQNDRVDSSAFMEAYGIEGNRISVQNGNIHNQYEYFVSAYLIFMSNPLRLNNLCPLTYQYFLTC